MARRILRSRRRIIFGTLTILVALFVAKSLLLSLQVIPDHDARSNAETGHAADFSIMITPIHPLLSETKNNANNNNETYDDDDDNNNNNNDNAIFYNLFLPTTLPEKTPRVFGDAWSAWDDATKSIQFANYLERVTQEQVQQWQEHQTTSSNHHHTTLLLLWYTHIGNPVLPNALRNCTRQGTCRRVRYLSKGNEIDTLDVLYQYCHAHPNETVAYIHNKGSFHASFINQQQRREGTNTALACLHHLTTRNENIVEDDDHDASSSRNFCNVCAGNFQVAPQFLTLSNMWSAHCEYVRQLIPPRQFESQLQSMYSDTILHPILKNTTYSCLTPVSTAPNHLGRGRYAMERWVWSHPDLRPCHVVPPPPPEEYDDETSNNNKNTSSSSSSSWGLVRGPTHKQIGRLLKRVTDNFARLEGRLFEYLYLYGKLPPTTSWIWSYYKPKFRQGGPAYMKNCLANHPDACTMLPVDVGIFDSDTERQMRHRICNVSKHPS